VDTKHYHTTGKLVYETVIQLRHTPDARERFLQEILESGYQLFEVGAIMDYAIYLFLENMPEEWTVGLLTETDIDRIFSFINFDIQHWTDSEVESARRLASLLYTVSPERRGQFLRKFFDCIMLFYNHGDDSTVTGEAEDASVYTKPIYTGLEGRA